METPQAEVAPGEVDSHIRQHGEAQTQRAAEQTVPEELQAVRIAPHRIDTGQ